MFHFAYFCVVNFFCCSENKHVSVSEYELIRRIYEFQISNIYPLHPQTVKNSASRIPAYLLIFHLIGVIISLALFLCNLHHLQQDSGKKVVSLDFGMDLEVYLSTLYKFVSPLIIIGLTLVLIVIFCSGKEALLVRKDTVLFR